MSKHKLLQMITRLKNKYTFERSYEEDLFVELIEALLEDNEIELLEKEDVGKTKSSI